jgi:uncharacterized repeat protein (TIGR03803 family)
MFHSSPIRSLIHAAACSALTLALATTAHAQTETIPRDVTEPSGASPITQLIQDAAGNLYGTTLSGGLYNDGVVFELEQGPDGGWTQKVLYNFSEIIWNGYVGRLLLDSAGNLYGTVPYGGPTCGFVYRLSPSASSSWNFTNIHSFNCSFGSTDGQVPSSGLTMDKAGNLYGVTSSGGFYYHDFYLGGAVYELTPSGNGQWTEQVLYSFSFLGPGGYAPQYELILDSSGNIFGVTTLGADNNCFLDIPKLLETGCGTVFELTESAGVWNENILHTFTEPVLGAEQYFGPIMGLTMDSAGNLYGSTTTAFYEVQPNNQGPWTYLQLAPAVGANGPLLIDKQGNFYADTQQGGNGNGFAFELHNSDGRWSLDTIYAFPAPTPYVYPRPLSMDTNGNLFGTTLESYTQDDDGAIFELKPSSDGTWIENTLYQFPAAE